MIDTYTLNGNLIYLSLGSNLGDKLQNIGAASELIWSRLGNPGMVSQVYKSSSWGYTSKNIFYNCCLSVSTNIDPLPLMDELLSIEKVLGRERDVEGYSDRLIDIDVLFFGELILNHIHLKIPHPSIPHRRFVLQPLSEIAPDLVHPGNGLTVLTMLNLCQDSGMVKPI